ncbi:DUF554 domain-containing protein [Candidatus Xianfuyuplasma coldseepsis]|uniref:DUF554 domain-containing protein n=1 Tax=Candidatus Xianfuyuplasma coldseepsis TaxID=2782163 RepID=A0A7L7KP73_9MOLU|nr:DUF554 domain-containing protein [Xianfuyuplasma coldseepsis]QMS84581.1 DUF554 domain-containing protein [Xianfuyuplasma coldseepsis]
MLAVLVNVAAIVIGGLIGLLLKKGIPNHVKRVIMQGIGLSVIVIGMMGAMQTNNVLLLVISLAIGGTIGALIQIEKRLDDLGTKIEDKFSREEGSFAKGFVTASLIYCVGAMAILGSIQAGVHQDYSTLFVKSILDGVTAIIFTATLGYGVIFSAIPVLIYQGAIVLLGIQLEPLLINELTTEMDAVGNVIIMGIGITLLDIKKIHVGDLLPAIFIPVVYFLILPYVQDVIQWIF